MHAVPPPTLNTGGLDGTSGSATVTGARGPGVGVTGATGGGDGVVLGGTTTATFGGAARVGSFGLAACTTAFGFNFAFGFGLAFSSGVSVGFGVSVGVGVSVGFGVGVAIKVRGCVTRTAAGEGGVEGVWVAVGDGVVWGAGASFVACCFGGAELGDELAGGTTTGSAFAQLLRTPGPGHVNANAVNANTMIAKASSATLDRPDEYSPHMLNTGTG